MSIEFKYKKYCTDFIYSKITDGTLHLTPHYLGGFGDLLQ
jgi:hypothetical protein